MHRLFVAIRPPVPVRQLLLANMGGISGARWQSDDQLHLTLRFIGEVDRHLAEDVHAALGGIHHPPFELALNGIGCFDRRGFPDAVWAGVTPHEQVKALHKKVDAALLRVGVPADERAFLPHITLARLRRGAGCRSMRIPPRAWRRSAQGSRRWRRFASSPARWESCAAGGSRR